MHNANSVIEPTPKSNREVEVVTMLGDSVVDVAHLDVRATPRGRRPAYFLLAAAAVLAIVAAFAFAVGVQTAADNERALAEWSQGGEHAHDFRPKLINPAYDWMAFGGLAGAVLCLGLGIARLRTQERRATLSIGKSRDADICYADAPGELNPLVYRANGESLVHVAPPMNVVFRRSGQVCDIEQLAALGVAKYSAIRSVGYDLPVPESGCLDIRIGPLRFAIRSVAIAPSRLGSLFARFDERMAKFFGVSAIVHMAILALLSALPPDPHSLAMDPDGSEARWRRIRIKASENANRQPGRDAASGVGSTQPDHTSALPPGEIVADKPGRSISPTRETRRPSTRDDAIRNARDIGINAILRDNPSAFRHLVDARNPFSSDADIYNLVLDDDHGADDDSFGGPITGRNTGPRKGPGSIATGDYNTTGWRISKRPGTGDDPENGPDLERGPYLTDREPENRTLVVDIEKPVVLGDLDQSIIRRYIRRKLPRISHCYERELFQNPEISGTVTTEFLVNGQGNVVYAKASGMGNKRLESCVAEVVGTVHFPMPDDSGAVQVKYPFHFRRAG